jgi:hypothetical protein
VRIKSEAKKARVLSRRAQRQPVELISRLGGTRFVFQGAFKNFEDFKVRMRAELAKLDPAEQERLLKLVRGEGIPLDAEGKPRSPPLPKRLLRRLSEFAAPAKIFYRDKKRGG